MRLFIAIIFQEPFKDEIMKVTRELQQSAVKGNYTLRENLHLTIVFLGEVAQERVGSIKTAMNRVKAEPFQLSLDKTGLFKRNGGDVFWIGIKKSDVLDSIHRQLTEELAGSGFLLEERKYTPHLTIGREVKLKDTPAAFLSEEIFRNSSMTASRISLMKSERINGKLNYTEVYGKNLIG
jgi:2''-5'' RNA ligase